MPKNPSLTIEDYHDVVRMFHDESDRGAAVLAGSYLENYLGNFLQSLMVGDADVRELFGPFGPLSDFSQRIACAHAFGFISSELKNDLHFVKKIRNHFAHHPLEAKFDAPPIDQWVSNLSTATFEHPGDPYVTSGEDKLKYLLAISGAIVAMHNDILRRGRAGVA